LSYRKRFSGRIALVSGGQGGIGSAVVRSLQAEGARVAVLDRTGPAGPADLSLACDVTDPQSVSHAVEEVAAQLGAPDLLVCAAGVVSEHDMADMPAAEWHRVVDASLTGCFLLVRAALPHLCRSDAGAVVALSSGWATKGYPRGAHYAAAKAGVEALVKSVALEVAARGVRVNAVAPGPVLTPFLDYVEDMESWRAQRESAIPLGRVAEPDDVVGPVLFLLSEESRYVTGQVLHVNGGLLMP
jgi:NAD(P)-dependent dehydrogenase (short-subunit alcohol dehydrogenase family)